MASKSQANAFLAMMVPIAQRQAKKHDNKIFASVCIAQAIHESGWGTSPKMKNANAVFGIKVGNSAYKFGTAWKGDSYNTKTKEYYNGSLTPTVITDIFRAYSSVEDATEDYFDMLCHCKRYKGALNQPTPEACIRGIIAGGYATGPSYVNAIINLIKQYNLTQYDKEGAIVKDVSNKTPTKPSYYLGRTYITNVNLFIRVEPEGEKMPLELITKNGKQHSYDDGYGFAILKKGTRVTCQGVAELKNGDIWIKIPSGYIAAYNRGKVYVEQI